MTRDKEAAVKVKVKLDTITPGDAIAKQQCHGFLSASGLGIAIIRLGGFLLFSLLFD